MIDIVNTVLLLSCLFVLLNVRCRIKAMHQTWREWANDVKRQQDPDPQKSSLTMWD